MRLPSALEWQWLIVLVVLGHAAYRLGGGAIADGERSGFFPSPTDSA